MAKKRDQRYKLPRNWIVIPLIIYTLIFFIVIVIISVSFGLFSGYATNLKARGEIENTYRLAKMYDQASPEEKDRIIESLRKNGKFEFFIADSNEKIIYQDNEVTAVFKDPDNKESAGGIGLITLNLFGFRGYDFLIDGDSLTFGENVCLYRDKETQFMDVDESSISPDMFEMITSSTYWESVSNNGDSFSTPYWIGFKVKNNTEMIVFKSYLVLDFTDLFFFLAYYVLLNSIADIFFIILVVNLIRTHRKNRKMRKILFQDNITTDHNWFWFVINSRKLLKKKSISTRYAMVSLVFVRYRNYVLCHTVDDGEHLLRQFYEVIAGYLDSGEICAHSGISTFPILIKAESEETARKKIDRIIKCLEKIGGDKHDFSFQAGIYMIDPGIRKNADIELIYNNASSARSTLKDTEDTGIAFFDDKLVEDEKWIDKVQARQQKAIDNEEFKVYYQPKYDPRTNELMGAEALIRWQTDDMGLVPPGKFIPIFETSGFITEIDHYMLKHVAADQRRWLDEGKKCVPVSVNISRAHFAETDLAEEIRDMVNKAGTPHDLIEIELTESAFFDDKKVMLTTIRKLKEYGFLVSMDDFGSGYSSLNSLKDMPLDILKLDAGFFRGDNDNGRTEIVVSEALQLAKKLKMTTVAEGVEEQAQVDFLAAEGCSMIQGYYYAKPMPKEEYEQRIGKPAPEHEKKTETAEIIQEQPEQLAQIQSEQAQSTEDQTAQSAPSAELQGKEPDNDE